MLYQSIKWGLISLLIILLIHYLYSFFKNTLTVPKVRYIPQNKLKAEGTGTKEMGTKKNGYKRNGYKKNGYIRRK